MNQDLFDKGLKTRREVLGSEYVDGAIKNADSFNMPLQEMVTQYAWGDVWNRPGLDRRTRSLLNLAMLTALNRPHELKLHLRGAITNGVTKEEIQEVFLHCAITPFGQTGPWAQRQGHDLHLQALCGWIPVPEGAPSLPAPVCSLLGASAALAILSAVHDQRAGGPGRYIDIALHALLASHPSPNPDPHAPNHALYRCQDGLWIALAALHAAQWRRLCEVLHLPHLAALAHAEGIAALRVKKELQDLFASHIRAHWLALFDGVDAGLEPLLDSEDALGHSAFVDRLGGQSAEAWVQFGLSSPT